ncbi:cytochrome c oxidase subunit 13, mitochondrial [Trichomonascus vanleenenianus]|uniref:cytochrome c oxidase subunit VIa n=1 Tax=Trichomonascus vanleenenianus TaxID=2268995 RepID=UPI003ECA1EEC
MISRALMRPSMAMAARRAYSVAAAPANATARLQELSQQVAKEMPVESEAGQAKLRFLLAQEGMTLYKTNVEAGKALFERYEQTREHGVHTADLWRKISIYVFIPALLLAGLSTYYVEAEHAEHRKHLNLDEQKIYDFQALKIKDYFWGDGATTMFFNPTVNKKRED